jgi:hypothetical protein
MAYVMVKTKHGVVTYVAMTVTVVTVLKTNAPIVVMVAAVVETVMMVAVLNLNLPMIGIVQVLQAQVH